MRHPLSGLTKKQREVYELLVVRQASVFRLDVKGEVIWVANDCSMTKIDHRTAEALKRKGFIARWLIFPHEGKEGYSPVSLEYPGDKE